MRLLSLNLQGEYKGLVNQFFDFSRSHGNVLALIGLNGSGKSQLLELIGEIFSFLERSQRSDFVVKKALGFGFEIVYQLDDVASHQAGSPTMVAGSPLAVAGEIVDQKFKVRVGSNSTSPQVYISIDNEWISTPIETLTLPYVIGYSSGLNENLQRSFMKNAVQYFEIMRIRFKRRKELAESRSESEAAAINRRYLDKFPNIFSSNTGEAMEQDGYLSLREADTLISRAIYLDYDSVPLLLVSMSIFSKEEIEDLYQEVKFKYPEKATFNYDFRSGVVEEDAIRDIKLLIRVAGEDNFNGVGSRATPEQYELYELNFLAGSITLDLTDDNVLSRLRESHYNDPIAIFRRLYKVQQLGVKNWHRSMRLLLQNDSFQETVKKPLKTKLPLCVTKLILSDGHGNTVSFDDLSDGESQLIQILSAVKVFSSQHTLFLLDEPETHLNPSWRTYFHHHLSQAASRADDQSENSQVFVSTHSPFMVSSLRKENVFFFERDGEGFIKMDDIDSQTYGASFEVLTKKYFGLRSLISQTVVDEVKAHLPSDETLESLATSRAWIEENLGESMEKAYLLRKLES